MKNLREEKDELHQTEKLLPSHQESKARKTINPGLYRHLCCFLQVIHYPYHTLSFGGPQCYAKHTDTQKNKKY